MIGQVVRLASTVRMELDKGVRNTEGLRPLLVKKSDEMAAVNRELGNCKRMRLFRDSEIPRNYKTRPTARTPSVNQAFVDGYISANARDQFRGDFRLYLSNVDERLSKEIVSGKWGHSKTYGNTRIGEANNPWAHEMTTRFIDIVKGKWNGGEKSKGMQRRGLKQIPGRTR